MNANRAKVAYSLYAKNIDVKILQADFHGAIGETIDVHGDKKSFRTKDNITFHSTTMRTSDGKFKVWVYRGPDYNWLQDTFEIKEPTNEEFLKVLLERSTGLDADGKKVVIAN
jgi:hypothetical protein